MRHLHLRIARLGRSEISRLAGAGLTVQMLTLVSGPLVARMLGASGRGEVTVAMLYSILSSRLVLAGWCVTITRELAQQAWAARTALGPLVGRSGIASAIPALLAGLLTAATLHSSPHMLQVASATAVITLLASVTLVMTAMLQGEGQVRHVNRLRLISVLLYVLGIALIFLVDRQSHAIVVLAVYAGAQTIGLGVAWQALRPREAEGARLAGRALLRSARRAHLGAIGFLDGMGLDHVVVAVMMSTTSLGLYTVASSSTNLPVMVLQGVSGMLLPRMAARDAEESRRLLFRWTAASTALVACVVIGLEIIIGPAIRILFGTEFVPATPVARLLIVAWALLALRRLFISAAQAQHRAGRSSVVEAASAIALVVGVPVGIATHGIVGAAAAVLAVSALSCAALAATVSWRVPRQATPRRADQRTSS
ncbi:hypothetical protein GCM10011584_32690 [Nocardioides phosphati]|uniref:Oligosaccharide flippase family protein n=1 Tax=Nocardioides phosphati TaxID=1867775 RepID=A0ABQ2NGA1_9ACTN|nr:oligosaccharide flippase family protein [Nocardioides phosphati]GGO93603.1 hypothetical protein GCM10011584_32690 [Nocardioides phosphati]